MSDSVEDGFEQDGGAPAPLPKRVTGDKVPEEPHHGMCTVSDQTGKGLMPLPSAEAKPATSDSEITRRLRVSRLEVAFMDFREEDFYR